MDKKCNSCSVILIPGSNWTQGQINGRVNKCRNCMSETGKKWAKENKARANANARARRQANPEAAKVYRSEYYEKNREKWIAYGAAYRHEDRIDPVRRARRINTWTRTRAKKMGLDFDLTPDFIYKMLAAGKCPVTGIDFVLSEKEDGKKGTDPFAPSLDRIDPTRGYTQDNVRLVSYIYNCAKSEHSDKDVERMARAILATLSSG